MSEVPFIRPLLPNWLEAWSPVIGATLMWWAALGFNYVERRGWGQLARQYARMYRVFGNSEIHLNNFRSRNNFELCGKTIYELGCGALAESGDWLAAHRERKLSLKMVVG